jgi:Putative Actinobacterial Holin-X, holin superfamily III
MNDFASRTATGRQAPLASSIGKVLDDVCEIAGDHVELAILEARYGLLRLGRTLAFVVFIAIVTASAWLALVASAVAWAASTGISVAAACALAAMSNLLVAGIAAAWLRSRERELPFAATLRQIRRSVSGAKPEIAHE